MSDILTHIDAGVMTLTFNRLDKKNSITGDMYAAMAKAVDQAQADAAIRVLVIQGHESIFSAGNDIGDFLNKPPSTVDSSVFHFMVYAGDNAAFSMPFVNLGLCPEFASSMLAPQMFGYHRAAEALLLGEAFFAEAALEIGLVNRVVPPTEVNGYAQAQAKKMAAKPLTALIETKRLMKSGQSKFLIERMGEEGQSFRRMLSEPAAREAFGAFMEKRKPDFSKI